MRLCVLLALSCLALDIHLIPHSHCDTAWQATPEAYFPSVTAILDQVVVWLEADSIHTFAWAELYRLLRYFFSRWFDAQNEGKQRKVRQLVTSGQLEFVGGGWVQMDTAVTDLDMQTMNLAKGLRYLRREFNVTSAPVAWDVDSFGMSALTPALYSRFGYRELVVGRIDADFRLQLQPRGGLEFLWETSLGAQPILTHILSGNYQAPSYLNPASSEYCLNGPGTEKCLRKLADQAALMRQTTGSSAVLLLYGGDFAFGPLDSLPSPLFAALTTLQTAFNAKYQSLRVLLSTPSRYFRHIAQSSRLFPTFSGELLPYMTRHDSASPTYWTGFYSTRPALKAKIKKAVGLSRSARLLSALALGQDWDSEVEEALHHDAIACTLREHAAVQLGDKMEACANQAEKQLYEVAVHMLNRTQGVRRLGRPVVIVNSLNWERESLQSLSVPHPYYQLRSPLYEIVPSQYFSHPSSQNYTLYFLSKVPALASVVYFLIEKDENCSECAFPSIPLEEPVLRNAEITISMGIDGFPLWIQSKEEKIAFEKMAFRTYSTVNSGIYVFKPNSKGQILDFPLSSYILATGPVLSIAISQWNSAFTQTILLPKQSLGYFLYSLAVFALGNETMLDISFPSLSNSAFFAFSDGALRQKVYFDPIFNARIGKNFHPITSAVFIGNESMAFGLFPDYSMGIGQVGKDTIALHLHRSGLFDDGNGLEEGFEDGSMAIHSFRVTVSPIYDDIVWKNALEQASPLVVLAGNSTLEWEMGTAAGISFDRPDLYIHSLENGMLRVLNLRAFGTDFSMDGVNVVGKTGLGGFPVRPRAFEAATSPPICFETCKNGAIGAIRYRQPCTSGSFLSPYEYSGLFLSGLPLASALDWNNSLVHPACFSGFTLKYTSASLPFQSAASPPPVLTNRPFDFMSHRAATPTSTTPGASPASFQFLLVAAVSFAVLSLLATLLYCPRHIC